MVVATRQTRRAPPVSRKNRWFFLDFRKNRQEIRHSEAARGRQTQPERERRAAREQHERENALIDAELAVTLSPDDLGDDGAERHLIEFGRARRWVSQPEQQTTRRESRSGQRHLPHASAPFSRPRSPSPASEGRRHLIPVFRFENGAAKTNAFRRNSREIQSCPRSENRVCPWPETETHPSFCRRRLCESHHFFAGRTVSFAALATTEAQNSLCRNLDRCTCRRVTLHASFSPLDYKLPKLGIVNRFLASLWATDTSDSKVTLACFLLIPAAGTLPSMIWVLVFGLAVSGGPFL